MDARLETRRGLFGFTDARRDEEEEGEAPRGDSAGARGRGLGGEDPPGRGSARGAGGGETRMAGAVGFVCGVVLSQVGRTLRVYR